MTDLSVMFRGSECFSASEDRLKTASAYVHDVVGYGRWAVATNTCAETSSRLVNCTLKVSQFQLRGLWEAPVDVGLVGFALDHVCAFICAWVKL